MAKEPPPTPTVEDYISLIFAVVFFIFILGTLSTLVHSCCRSVSFGLETTTPTTPTTHSPLPPPTPTNTSITVKKSSPTHSLPTNISPSLVAVLITTNLVSVPCPCGSCNPTNGTRVLEHINQIGYDLALQVSTNYLPVIRIVRGNPTL